MNRRAATLTLFTVILVAGCAGSGSPATPSTAPGMGTPGVVSPTAAMLPSHDASPAQTGSATASPSPAALDPSTAHWARIGTVGAGPAGGELIGFDRGYVALGSRGNSEEPIAWFSTDGRGWDVTSLANQVPNCQGWGPPGNENVPDADAGAIATNGHELIIVGAESPHDTAGCADVGSSIRPTAWLSDDGRTWRRSEPFYTGGPNGRATAVWAAPDGWQAVAEAPASGTISLWHSVDGLHWRSAGDVVDAETGSVNAWAAADGAMVLSRVAEDGVPRLFTTRDGQTWTPIEKAGGCKGVTQIVAPTSPGLDAWVVVSDSRVCTSVDLVTWSTTELPMAVTRIAQTRFGAIALGDTCHGEGSDCPDPGPRAYLTADGVTWSRLSHPKVFYGRSLADGPAGVLLIGTGPDDGSGSHVWQLEP